MLLNEEKQSQISNAYHFVNKINFFYELRCLRVTRDIVTYSDW